MQQKKFPCLKFYVIYVEIKVLLSFENYIVQMVALMRNIHLEQFFSFQSLLAIIQNLFNFFLKDSRTKDYV